MRAGTGYVHSVHVHDEATLHITSGKLLPPAHTAPHSLSPQSMLESRQTLGSAEHVMLHVPVVEQLTVALRHALLPAHETLHA